MQIYKDIFRHFATRHHASLGTKASSRLLVKVIKEWGIRHVLKYKSDVVNMVIAANYQSDSCNTSVFT